MFSGSSTTTSEITPVGGSDEEGGIKIAFKFHVGSLIAYLKHSELEPNICEVAFTGFNLIFLKNPFDYTINTRPFITFI